MPKSNFELEDIDIPEGMTLEEYLIQYFEQLEQKEIEDDEEILKVLKGEQDVMYETPIPSENLVVTEQSELMDYDFEAMNNMVEIEIQPTPNPYMYYGMDAI